MSKILLTMGLPASGKSTYARQLVAESCGQWKRVNRDTLREMIDASLWSQKKEDMIRKAEMALAEMFIQAGHDVVVDDTNLAPSAKKMWADFAKEKGVALQTKFFEITVAEAIKRDLARPNSVGADVIKRMHTDFLSPKAQQYMAKPGTPKAIMVDMDGTLAHHTKRGVFDYSRVDEDILDEPVAAVIRSFADQGYSILVLSGRDDSCQDKTEAWLKDNSIPFDQVWMRQTGDKRKDSIVKLEIFDREIRDRYDVLFAIDDRLSVCQTWHSIGLKLFRVGDPDADF